jgi:tetratricopeptide (TPR) repeat protein
MSQSDESQIARWLQEGIAAAKAGRQSQARQLLMRVVEVNERNELAWTWLSSVVETDEDRLICLENVLTLDPDNVQARAGLRWLRERGVGSHSQTDLTGLGPVIPDTDTGADYGSGPESEPQAGPALDWLAGGEVQTAAAGASAMAPVPQPVPAASSAQAADSFMSPDGCVYCGLDIEERDSHCPHCGNRLSSKHFVKADRSFTGALLHAYWLVLAGINVVDFFIIGFIWNREIDPVFDFLKGYLELVAGPVVLGESTLDTFLGPDATIQAVRFLLLGLAVLGVLVALGLFLRISRAHALGLALIAIYLLVGLLLFALGVTGYLLALLRGLFTVMLTLFMFQTVEDFAKEERRERLEIDRHLVNDVDYYTRGRLYAKRGMWAKALLHWQRAAARNPDRDAYFGALARAYAQLGRYKDALEHVESAIRVSRVPEDWRELQAGLLRLQEQAVATGVQADARDTPPLAFE